MSDLISRNLSLLASIREGDTISKMGEILVVTPHNAWFTKIMRRFYSNDTKDSTLGYVNNIIATAFFKDIKITKDVIDGLCNLKKTYIYYSDFCLKIDNTISKIDKHNNPQPMNITQSEIIEIVKDRIEKRKSPENSYANESLMTYYESLHNDPFKRNIARDVDGLLDDDEEEFRSTLSLSIG